MMEKEYNLKIKYYNGSMQVKYYLKPIKKEDESLIDEIIGSQEKFDLAVEKKEDESLLDEIIGSQEKFDLAVEKKEDESLLDEIIGSQEKVDSSSSGSCLYEKGHFTDKERCIRNSISRTVNKIYDYARSNEWEYFITLTINSKMDRYNYSDVKKKVCKTFNNWRYRKCPNLKYLLVHEYHKDGAIHFHGLLANCEGLTFDMARNPKNNKVLRDNNLRTIYNILDFKLGFCTATKVSDTFKASSYICKYISKDVTLDTYIPNIQRYFVSNNCDLPKEFTYSITKQEFFEFMSGLNPDFHKVIKSDYNTVFLYEINDNEKDSSIT